MTTSMFLNLSTQSIATDLSEGGGGDSNATSVLAAQRLYFSRKAACARHESTAPMRDAAPLNEGDAREPNGEWTTISSREVRDDNQSAACQRSARDFSAGKNHFVQETSSGSAQQAHDISVLFGLPLLVSAPLVAAELAEASLRAAAAPARLLLDSDEGFTLEDAAAPAPDDSVACGSPLAGMFAPPSQLPPYQGDALRVIAFADVLCVRRSYVREECAALQPATLRLLGAQGHAEAAEGAGTSPEAAAPQFHLEVILAGSHVLQRTESSGDRSACGIGSRSLGELAGLQHHLSPNLSTCSAASSSIVGCDALRDDAFAAIGSESSSPQRAVFVLSIANFAAAETLYAFIREGAAANVIHTFHLPHVVPLL